MRKMGVFDKDQLQATKPLLHSDPEQYKKLQFTGSSNTSLKQENQPLSPWKHNGYGSTSCEQENLTLAWRNLSVYAPEKGTRFTRGSDPCQPAKQIINKVSGALTSGTLMAVIGASGAGKSTLINALAHRTAAGMVVEGDVLVNGQKIDSAITLVSNYLPQDGVFMGTLTAKEHLTFMANLKMDRRSNCEQREAMVMKLLRDMGLIDAQNTRIGVLGSDKSLSGGERKRLAFASEILTNPQLIFFDEPTTGLDFFTAINIVKIIKNITTQGKSIICSIHQASQEVFSMFDTVLLLAEGCVAYMGSSDDALKFFESVGFKCPVTFNPADHYINTLTVFPGNETHSRNRIKRICDSYAMSDYCRDIDMTIQFQSNLDHTEESLFRNIPEKPGWWSQFRWLMWRSLIDSYRNSAIHSIMLIRLIIPGLIMEAVAYTSICYWMVGLQPHAYHFTIAVLSIIFVASAAFAYGLSTSIIFNNCSNNLSLAVGINMVLYITSGFYSDLKSLPWFIGWMKYLSWYMYGMEILTVTQWSGITNITCEMPPGVPCITTGEEVIQKYSFQAFHVPYDFGLITLICCCFHILGLILLHLRAKNN